MTVLNTETPPGYRYLALLEEMGLGGEPPMPETLQSSIGQPTAIGAVNDGPDGGVGTP